jgi:ornithine decarboxylase
MTEKINRFLRERDPPTPCLVVDLEVVRRKFRELRQSLPMTDVFYAVKANPADEILALLMEEGSSFDVASPAEIDLCLKLGAEPERLSYGNTIKKEADIRYAHERGIRLFAFDSEAELRKIARAAPGAQVAVRLLVDNQGAEWPLSRKFGCTPDMARDLLVEAERLGLEAYGASFHVGSQQTVIEAWDQAVFQAAELFRSLERVGIVLKMLNLGGGMPARYRADVDGVEAHSEAIKTAVSRHFGNRPPRLIVEPGRYMVGEAGVLQSEVVLISKKGYEEETRWVYLDVGRFSGLAETEGEAIKYRIVAGDEEHRPKGPVVLAGPTCDSADILYERSGYELPLDLQVGDRVQILAAGAYTTTYSSVGFNGFEPLRAYYV